MRIIDQIRSYFNEVPGEFVPPSLAPGANAHAVATIRQMKNGRYRLLSGEFGNEVVATYNRRPDAVRGAKRRGLEIINVSS